MYIYICTCIHIRAVHTIDTTYTTDIMRTNMTHAFVIYIFMHACMRVHTDTFAFTHRNGERVPVMEILSLALNQEHSQW